MLSTVSTNDAPPSEKNHDPSIAPSEKSGMTATSNGSSESSGEVETIKKPKSFLQATPVQMGDFESEKHFYPRVLNATIHPLVASFLLLGNERIIRRYCHLNPQVNEDVLRELLNYKPTYFHWAGTTTLHHSQ